LPSLPPPFPFPRPTWDTPSYTHTHTHKRAPSYSLSDIHMGWQTCTYPYFPLPSLGQAGQYPTAHAKNTPS
jgi:hypothetical protein